MTSSTILMLGALIEVVLFVVMRYQMRRNVR